MGGEPPSPATKPSASDDPETAELKAKVAALEAKLEETKVTTERAARDKRQLEKALRQLLTMAGASDEKKAEAKTATNDEEARACREALRAATTKDALTAAVERCEKAGLKYEAEVGKKKLGKM